MKFGILKDVKRGESRVVATPKEVSSLVMDGFEVYVQAGAGDRAGFVDEEYKAAGAVILATNKEIWDTCEFVAKVKEIEESEYDLMHEGQIIYCCVHPAAHKQEVDALLEKKVIAFSAEDSHRYGSPNCEAAGKVGAFMGVWSMMTMNGGTGKFGFNMSNAPKVTALVCGCGKVGSNAIETLLKMDICVTACDVFQDRLDQMYAAHDGRINTLIASKENLTNALPKTDIVLNCVRWPKDASEPMITREMVASMRRGSVIVDISNDYGCIETFRETTLDNPTYIEEGVVHYCVSNIPGSIAAATSASYAAAILPHFKAILSKGLKQACIDDGFLRRSLTTYMGFLTHEETSGIQGRPWIQPEVILGIGEENLDPAPKTTVTRSEFFYEPGSYII